MNIIVMPNVKEDVRLLTKDIKGMILNIKNLSVNSNVFFNISEVEEIIKNTDKEIFISLNKIFHNKDLPELEEVLKIISKYPKVKILFYDLAVLNISKRLKIENELVVYRDHLNASINSHEFYEKEGVKYSFITSDITYEETLDVKKNTNIKILKQVYGYVPIFYSRRYLVTNYLKYINENKKDNQYYIKHNEDYYVICEEDEGTTIYTKEKINLINELDKLKDIDYLVINGYLEDNLEEIVNNYINRDTNNNENYVGFFNTKTIYKVINNE